MTFEIKSPLCMECNGCSDCNCKKSSILTSTTHRELMDKLRIFHDLVCVVMNANCLDLPRLMGKFIYMLWCFLLDIVNQIMALVEMMRCITERTDELLDNQKALCTSQGLIVDKINEQIKQSNAIAETKRAEYLKEMELYNRTIEENKRLLAEYETKLSQYREQQANNTKLTQDYEEALAEYNTKIAENKKLLEDYEKSLQEYNTRLQQAGANDEEYNRLYQEYQTKLQEYTVAKAKYDADMLAYQRRQQEIANYRPTNYTVTNVSVLGSASTSTDSVAGDVMTGSVNGNTGEFRFSHTMYVANLKLGDGYLSGRINHRYTVNSDGSIQVHIDSVTLTNYRYVWNGNSYYGVDSLIDFSVDSYTGAKVYQSRYHRGMESFTETINKTFTVGISQRVSPKTSTSWIRVFAVHDNWDMDTRGTAYLKYTNNNDRIVINNPPQPLPLPVLTVTEPKPPTKNTVDVGNPPVRPNITEPSKPDQPILITPVEPSRPVVTDSPKPIEPTIPRINELNLTCTVEEFSCDPTVPVSADKL